MSGTADIDPVNFVGNLAIVGNGIHGFLVALLGPFVVLITLIPDESDGTPTTANGPLVSAYLIVLVLTLGAVIAPSFWRPLGRYLMGASGVLHLTAAALLISLVRSPVLFGVGLALWPALVGLGLIGHARSKDSPVFV